VAAVVDCGHALPAPQAAGQIEEAVTSMSELAEVIAQRWQEGDERERQMLKLTRRLERLTWAVVALRHRHARRDGWAVLHG
jgi:uncharacterized coiled-coil protein SlyX